MCVCLCVCVCDSAGGVSVKILVLQQEAPSLAAQLPQPDRVRLLLTNLAQLMDMNRESVKKTQRKSQRLPSSVSGQYLGRWGQRKRTPAVFLHLPKLACHLSALYLSLSLSFWLYALPNSNLFWFFSLVAMVTFLSWCVRLSVGRSPDVCERERDGSHLEKNQRRVQNTRQLGRVSEVHVCTHAHTHTCTSVTVSAVRLVNLV